MDRVLQAITELVKSPNSGCLASLSKEQLTEYASILSLRHTPGLGSRSLARILKKFGNAANSLNNIQAWGLLGIHHRTINAYTSNAWLKGAQQEWLEASQSSSSIILWSSSNYPSLLKQISDAPSLLYYRGDIQLLSSPCIALVGSRNPTTHSEAVAAAFGKSLSNSGITIVSGMALGIDRQAHAGALMGIGKSIGVLGTGIDKEYPISNTDIYNLMRRNGLLISEFSPCTPPMASNFPIRNRIISGLSLGVVVIEAAVRSGSLITARLALEQNREVFAVPGGAMDTHSMGCQNLVRQGAKAVFCGDDILQDLIELLRPYGIVPPKASIFSNADQALIPAVKSAKSNYVANVSTPEKPVSSSVQPVDEDTKIVSNSLLSNADGEKILKILKEAGKMDMDKLTELSGLTHGQISTAILALEMLGYIKRLPGAIFEAM